jgi:hypothetical protein
LTIPPEQDASHLNVWSYFRGPLQRGLLGDGLVKEQTPEYAFADEIYSLLELVEIVLRVQKKIFWIVGSLADDDIGLRKKSDDE